MCASTTCQLAEAHRNFSLHDNIQEKESYLIDFVSYTFSIVLHLDAYKLISFKLGKVIDMCKLCLIPV